MKLSVIVPAFNEEAYIGPTLEAIQAAASALGSSASADVEVIVVDNNSSDTTASIAKAKGAKVIHEPVQGIARARNTGARHAVGEALVFVDADVIMPAGLLELIRTALDDPACIGGGVDVTYRPRRFPVRLYLGAWRILGRLTGMVQGATQFCRRRAFEDVGGYDEKVWMGEDVDFYWTLKGLAKKTHARVAVIKDTPVCPSTRRFDKWPLWKILLWTNPAFIWAFRRRKHFWNGWYSFPVR